MVYSHISKFLQAASRRFIADTGAAVITIFAFMLPIIVGSAGISLDMSRAYLVQQRLQGALDAAALAGAASASDEEVIEERVRDFFERNYPDEKIGTVLDEDLAISVRESEVTVAATARYETSFMRILGRDHITVRASTTVNRQIMGLEVVMVLDVTGSMCQPDCTNLDALKTAATNFTTILFDRAEVPEDIKIGVVPYSTSVNVADYLFAKNADMSINYPSNTDYMSNLPYQVTYRPSNNTFSTSNSTRITWDPLAEEIIPASDNIILPNWRGCVLENRSSSLDITDHTGPWSAYYDTRRKSRTERYCSRYNANGTCRTYSNRTVYYIDPNEYCPRTPILPMTSVEQDVLDTITDLEAYGATLGNIGMVWGLRMISPEQPLNQAAPAEDRRWRKAVVMMTDGDNNLSATYTAYGLNSSHNLDSDDLNDKFASVCEAMEEEDILVYTVTFTSAISDDTKDFYRECATSDAQYHDAPTPEELIAVFERISRELSTLHIKN